MKDCFNNFENQDVLQFQLSITKKPRGSDFYGLPRNRVGNNIMEALQKIVETKLLVRTTHSQKYPEIDNVKV
jgi:hypothetical protein